MEHEDKGKSSINDVPDLMGMPKYKVQTSMSKHFCDFETYSSQHYGVEGFPLDYVVCRKLVTIYWADTMNSRCYSPSIGLSFFKLDGTDWYCCMFVEIIPWDDTHHLKTNDEKVLAQWGSDIYVHCRCDVFKHDNTIVFNSACVCFADLPGEIHYIPKKGQGLQSGHEAYFACKGQFVGINTAQLECLRR
jgi:hypothetical protein